MDIGVDTSESDEASYEMAKELRERQELATYIPDRNYVDYIVRIVQRTVKCEDALVRQIIYTAASKDTTDPQNLGIICPTSEGKTYAVTETLDNYPQKDVWPIGKMSPMVIVRDHSILVDATTLEPIGNELKSLRKELRKERRKPKKEIDDDTILELEDKIGDLYDNSKRLIDLQGKLLVFLEPPHPETWRILKPILSHDRYEIEYPYVEKTEGGGTKTIKIVTRGWPACIFCSAKNESNWSEWPEIQSRFLISSTYMIHEKYAEGNKITAQKYGLPRSVQQLLIVSDKEKKIAKMAVNQLLNMLKQGKETNQQVWIPYYEILCHSLPAEKGTDNRITNRIFALLSIITQCNAHLRCKLQDENEILPIADIEHDLAEVLLITQNITGIPTFKMQVFSEVVLKAYEDRKVPESDESSGKEERIRAVTTRQCCDKFKEVTGRTITTDTFKKTYLDEYIVNGLMDEEESVINKSRKIYYPIVDVSLYNGHSKEDEDQQKQGQGQDLDSDQKNASLTSNLGRFDVWLQQKRRLSPKNLKDIPKSWLKMQILFLLEHRIDEDNKAKSVPATLNGEFSILSPENEKVCIQCTDFLNASSLIRCCCDGTFVDDSQQVTERVQYLHQIYPCFCKYRSKRSDFDVKDVNIDTNEEKARSET